MKIENPLKQRNEIKPAGTLTASIMRLCSRVTKRGLSIRSRKVALGNTDPLLGRRLSYCSLFSSSALDPFVDELTLIPGSSSILLEWFLSTLLQNVYLIYLTLYYNLPEAIPLLFYSFLQFNNLRLQPRVSFLSNRNRIEK